MSRSAAPVSSSARPLAWLLLIQEGQNAIPVRRFKVEQALVLLAHIRSAFALSNETYGSPRMTRELQDSGLNVGRRRTARLMRENGLKARQKRRFKRTTDSLHAFPVAPNLLDQDFSAERPDEKWGADISYVWTREGWLYLALVMDLFARRVVGWAVSDRLHKELALTAL